MKKILQIFFVLFVACVSSCKKDWVCTCHYHISAYSPDNVFSYPINDATKKDATASCKASEDSIWAWGPDAS